MGREGTGYLETEPQWKCIYFPGFPFVAAFFRRILMMKRIDETSNKVRKLVKKVGKSDPVVTIAHLGLTEQVILPLLKIRPSKN